MKINYLKIFLLIGLIYIGHASAKLTQTLDRTDIGAGETFVLDIQIDNNEDVSPDLSTIPSDVTIVSNSQYQHTQIANGRRSSIKGWKLKLKTLKPGKLIIPPIAVGNELTQAIELDIKTSTFKADVNGQKNAIFLKAEVDNDTPYVQQQVIYTVSLYRSISTHYENLSTPEVKNSIIEKLGDDKVFEKMLNNIRYTVYQRKYIIFPQKSGDITIGPVNFTADVNDSNQRSRSLFLNTTRPISVSTEAFSLKVKPQPAQASNPWLPAESVILADSWTKTNTANTNNTSPSAVQTLKVGEPVTWSLLLTVQGLSESQLPELTIPPIDGLQMYPDSPQKERQVNEKGLLSKRLEKFAVIPTKAGKITIPAITQTWWDTKTNTQKTVNIAPRTFQVLAGAPTQQSATVIPELPQIPELQDTPTSVNNTYLKLWQAAVAILMLLWLTTLGLYFRLKGQSAENESRFNNPTLKQTSSVSQKQALAKAIKALQANSAAELESAIVTLVNSAGGNQYHSLGAIIAQVDNKALADKLSQIEKQRYSASQQTAEWSLKKADLEKLIDALFKSRKNAVSSSIPPLYPQ